MNAWRKLTATIIVAVICAFAFFYGSPIALVLFTKWENRNSPELWIVPKPLADVSIDRSPGQEFSCLGYQFDSPWAGVKTERKGHFTEVLGFNSGGVILLSKGSDKLQAMREAMAGRGASPESVLGREATSSNYALFSTILSLTPADLRFSFSRRQMVAHSVLIMFKGTEAQQIKGGVYSFQSEWLRGFQEGSPADASAVSVHAFDE